jgi:RimJ/RimL family protein N-acetyltransferase
LAAQPPNTALKKGEAMIIGKRIRLRAIEREDLPKFAAWLNDHEVRQYMMDAIPLSLENEKRWYETVIQQPRAQQPLAIEVFTSDGWEMIGNLGMFNLQEINRCAEVGIFIGDKRFWNQGYGREALRLILRHAFDHLNLNRIYLHVDEINLRGIRSYERAGFVHEGRLRQAQFVNGKYVDVLVMSVLRSEWQDNEI